MYIEWHIYLWNHVIHWPSAPTAPPPSTVWAQLVNNDEVGRTSVVTSGEHRQEARQRLESVAFGKQGGGASAYFELSYGPGLAGDGDTTRWLASTAFSITDVIQAPQKSAPVSTQLPSPASGSRFETLRIMSEVDFYFFFVRIRKIDIFTQWLPLNYWQYDTFVMDTVFIHLFIAIEFHVSFSLIQFHYKTEMVQQTIDGWKKKF